MKSRNDICKLRLARARSRTDYIPTMSSSDNGAPVEPAVAPSPDAGPARDERAPRYQVVQDRSPHGMMIEEQAARLAAIVRSSDHAIYSTSRDDVVETWNRGAERLYGYASAEVVGQSILTIIPAQCRAEHEEMLRRVLAGNWSVESFHSVRLTKAGQLVPVSIMISPIGEPDGMVVGVAVMMPEMSGAEFYEQLVARFPDVAPRVVFVTGGAFSPSARAFLDRVANERLNKPVDAQVLRALVQRRLS